MFVTKLYVVVISNLNGRSLSHFFRFKMLMTIVTWLESRQHWCFWSSMATLWFSTMSRGLHLRTYAHFVMLATPPRLATILVTLATRVLDSSQFSGYEFPSFLSLLRQSLLKNIMTSFVLPSYTLTSWFWFVFVRKSIWIDLSNDAF